MRAAGRGLQGIDFKSLRPAVWARVCNHLDGFAIGSTVAALNRRGVLRMLAAEGRVTVGGVRRRVRCNAGYLHGALRLLACQGWLERTGEPGTDEAEFSLNEAGKAAFELAPAYERAAEFLPAARRLEASMFGDGGAGARPSALQTLGRHVEEGWGLPQGDGLPARLRARVLDHLNGHVVTPVMSILSLRGALPFRDGRPPSVRLSELGGDRAELAAAYAVLARQGWFEVSGDRAEVTPEGVLAVSFAGQYWYPMGYLETFLRVPELLFGEPAVTQARTERGEETHVDRGLDIRFSAGVFSRTCRAPFLDIALPIFDAAPLEAQPASVVDTGCGDGTLLKVLYEGVRDRTVRGRHLERYPLVMVGAEPNVVAREAAAATLGASAIPHHVVDGNVADPEGLGRTLRSIGVDPEGALHVSKSVIHNRPFVPPEDSEGARRRPARTAGAFAAPDGSLVENRLLEQNLVEHFRRWRGAAGRHGLLVVEAHTVNPSTAAGLVGRSLATVVDATHCYSNQYLVEPEVFMSAAREAGLSSRAHRELGAETVGHVVLTIDHFITKEG